MLKGTITKGTILLLATVGLSGFAYQSNQENIKEQQDKQQKIEKEFFEYQAKQDKKMIIRNQKQKAQLAKMSVDFKKKIAEEKKKIAEQKQAEYEATLARQAEEKRKQEEEFAAWQAEIAQQEQIKKEQEAAALAAQTAQQEQQAQAQAQQNVQQTPVQQQQAEAPVQSSDAKSQIAMRESTNNYSATNGKYIGKYQLDAAYLNGDHSPANQEATADRYVAERYGSWEAALAFHNANGWY